ETLARGHEQAVTLQAAEADVGASLRQRDTADRGAVGRKHHDAVEIGRAHPPTAPQVAVDVAAHAVGCTGPGVDQDAAVGEPLAAEAIHQHGDRAVVFGARDAPPAVLAGDEPALAIAGVAVGKIRGLAVNAHLARLLLPLEDAIVGDVAPEQIAAVAEPHRA